MKKHILPRDLTLFISFGLIYVFIEVVFTSFLGIYSSTFMAFKGQSSLWMFVVGGITGVLLSHLFDWKISKLNLLYKTLIGVALVFLIEFVSGVVLNLLLNFHIWNYAYVPLNVLGQITFLYTPLWFALVPFVFFINDFLCWVFYDEVMDYDNIWEVYKRVFTASH